MRPRTATQPQQERSQRRRDAIIRAATEIAAADGFAAVTHRTVARRAGVPLGSTTYYFASLDDLLGEVAAAMITEWRARGTDAIDSAPDGPYRPRAAATLLAAAVLPGDRYARVHSYYEQVLAAARYPAVATTLRRARPALEGIVASALRKAGRADRISPALALAVIDGAALGALSEGRDDVVGFVADIAESLIAGLDGRSP